MGQKVLIVKGQKKAARLLGEDFVNEGFQVEMLYRGKLVLNAVRLNPPDVIILDITVPGKDMMTICKEIRKFSNVPILMLIAKDEDINDAKFLGLEEYDYICNPFNPREVVARAKTILRRSL